ncbi:hypothetical protein WJX72_003853 [[Myrmecia] bisecta]|uniref:Uncharacterized protein n=1 Tax=[Myrmecia] bisecta TaxID=41462 RepID=A0AAW1PEW3_9CHLO
MEEDENPALEGFPERLCLLPKLRSLCLNSYSINTLPSAMTRLTSLRRLYLSVNMVPSDAAIHLASLTGLVTLSVKAAISILGRSWVQSSQANSLSKLHNLEELTCECDDTIAPAWVGRLPRLKTLVLHDQGEYTGILPTLTALAPLAASLELQQTLMSLDKACVR